MSLLSANITINVNNVITTTTVNVAHYIPCAKCNSCYNYTRPYLHYPKKLAKNMKNKTEHIRKIADTNTILWLVWLLHIMWHLHAILLIWLIWLLHIIWILHIVCILHIV